jgi:dihydrofolate reductase
MHDNVADEMKKLKESSGKDILMIGSPTLAHSFMEMNLIDEFYINLNPVVIGSGKSLFKDVKIELDLVSSKEFSTGVIGLHYKLK